MPTIKITLKHGLKVGDSVLREVLLKDHLTAGEIRAAAEASEKVVMVDDGDGGKEPTLIISPTLMASEILRRQIKSIGDINGPISLKELDCLHEDDIGDVNAAAIPLEALKASTEVAQRGRIDKAVSA